VRHIVGSIAVISA